MKKCLVVAVVFMVGLSSVVCAIPPKFKKDLKEPRSIIMKCKTNVFYRKKYEGVSEKLDQAEKMLKEVAKKAGVDETDSDIARMLKSIKDCRKKLAKELAKQGKTPGAVKDNPMKIKETKKTPGKVTPKSTDTKEGEKKDATETGKMDVKAVRKGVNKAYTDMYYRKDYQGKKGELDGYEARLKELGLDESDSSAKRIFSKIKKSRELLAKHEAKMAKQKAYKDKKASEEKAKQEKLGDSLTVFNETKEDVMGMHALLTTMARTENTDEFYELAKKADVIFAQASALHGKVTAGIKDLRDFERNHKPAMKCGYRRKVEELERLLDDGLKRTAAQRVKSAKKTLLNECHSELESMKYYNKITLAAKGLDKIKKRFELLDSIAKGDAEVTREKKRILPAAQAAYEKLLKKVSKTKMPEEKYTGSDADKIRAAMATLYKAKYPDKVLKVVITSEDWKKQAVAEVNNDDKIVAGYYAYIYADIAVKKKSGCVVYPIGFRKTWTGKGDTFGSLEMRSIGVSYPILEKNAVK